MASKTKPATKTSSKKESVKKVEKVDFVLSDAQQGFIDTVGKTLVHMFELHAEQASVIKAYLDSPAARSVRYEGLTEKGKKMLKMVETDEDCDYTDINITGLIQAKHVLRIVETPKVPDEVQTAVSSLNGAYEQFFELVGSSLAGYRPGKSVKKASGSTGVKGVAEHGNITDSWAKSHEDSAAANGVSFRPDEAAPGYNYAVRDKDNKETRYTTNIERVWGIKLTAAPALA